MRPLSSDRCSHPDDEWCDECFIPTRHIGLLRSTEAEPEHRKLPPFRPGDVPSPASGLRLTEDQVREWQAILGGAGLDAARVEAELPVRAMTDSEARQVLEADEYRDPGAVDRRRRLTRAAPGTMIPVYCETDEHDHRLIHGPDCIEDPDVRARVLDGLAGRAPAKGEHCVNPRHDHGVLARPGKRACLDDTVPPYPLVHRAVGYAAAGTLFGVLGGVAAAWAIGRRVRDVAADTRTYIDLTAP